MNILVLLAEAFEETEFVTPFDFWQRGGLEVTTASISSSVDVTGSHGLQVKAQTTIDKVDIADFDAVFLPGGSIGVKNLAASEKVEKVLLDMDAAGKWILAICAAPLVLSKAGLLANRRCTCFPGCEVNLVCKEYSKDRVVVDGKVITSCGAGAAEEFALESLAQMTDRANSETIRKQVVAR